MSPRGKIDVPVQRMFGVKRLAIVAFGLAICGAANLRAQGPDGFRGPPPDGFFRFLDRNQDDRLDADEMARMPEPAREFLASKRIDTSRGISKEDFLRHADEMTTAMRERFQRDRGGDRRSDRGGDDRRDRDRRDSDSGSSSSATPSSSSSTPATPPKSTAPAKKPKPRVTADLPKNQAEWDADSDDQVSYLEWRKLHALPRSAFDAIDRDKDGYLTPKELIAANKSGATKTMTGKGGSASAATSGLVVATGTGQASAAKPAAAPPVAATSTPQNSAPAPAATKAPEASAAAGTPSVDVARAQTTFKSLDIDRDDKISPTEWARSRTLRPLFEKAGVDLTEPMPTEAFVKHYLKIVTKS